MKNKNLMGQPLSLEKPWCYLTVLMGYSVPAKRHTEPPSFNPAHKKLDGEHSISEKILAPAPFLALLREPLELFAFLCTSLEPQPGVDGGSVQQEGVCICQEVGKQRLSPSTCHDTCLRP